MLEVLHTTGGARLVVLSNRLGANRDSLRATLDELIRLGLIIRNPGYGHPLRPEYLLTALGKRLAPACARYRRAVIGANAAIVGYRKWTAPLLLVVYRGNQRFTTIQTALGGITPRALTMALRTLDEVGLMRRGIDGGYPPRAVYGLSKPGVRVAVAALGLANRLPTRIGG